MDTLEQQALIALVVAQAIEALKRASWFPWLQAHQKRALRVINVLSAGLASAGVVWAWSPDVPGRLVIDGLTWQNLASLLGAWVTQAGLQQGAYTGLIARHGAAIRARQVVYVDRGPSTAQIEAQAKAAADAVRAALRAPHAGEAGDVVD